LEKIHLNVPSLTAATHCLLCQTRAIELPFGAAQSSDKPGAFQCQEKNDFASDFFGFFFWRGYL
jgi:hypothetical protein